MDEENKNLIERIRTKNLEKLEEVEPGSNEAKALLNDLSDLNDIEERKRKLELEEEKLANENKNKKKERVQAWVTSAIGWVFQVAVGIGVPVLLSVMDHDFQTERGNALLEYEKTGMITSTEGRTRFSSIFRKK